MSFSATLAPQKLNKYNKYIQKCVSGCITNGQYLSATVSVFRSSETVSHVRAFQVVLVVKKSPANAGDGKRHGFDPWVGRIPWRRAWHSTPVFLPGESHGQRSLVGYSSRDHKESDTTEVT